MRTLSYNIQPGPINLKVSLTKIDTKLSILHLKNQIATIISSHFKKTPLIPKNYDFFFFLIASPIKKTQTKHK